MQNTSPDIPEAAPNVLEGYINKRELAAELCVSERTLDRWTRLRLGPPRTVIGRKILFSRQSVAAWLREREAANEQIS
jgi:hypothetical protein